MPLTLGQTNPDRLDHLLRDEVTVTQPQLVMVAQRQGPAHSGDGLLRLSQTGLQLTGGATGDGSEQMGRQNKIESPMQLVIREVGSRLLHRLNGLAEKQHLPLVGFHALTQALEKVMGFRQPLAACSFGFKQKRNGVQPETIHPSLQPEVHNLQHRFLHRGIGVIQIGLMPQEPVQVVLLRHWVPLPVGGFEMTEQHRGVAVTRRVITPDIHIVFRAALGGPAGPLEPRVQITGVIQHQVENDPHPLVMGRGQKAMKCRQIAEFGMNPGEIRDVVAAIPQG